MKVDPKVKRAIEEKLKVKIPSPRSPGFEAFMQQLSEDDPKAANLINSNMILSSVGDPSEQNALSMRFAAMRDRLRFALFMKHDELTEEFVISRGKMLMWTILPFVLLVVPTVFFPTLFRRGSAEAQEVQTEEIVAPSEGSLEFGVSGPYVAEVATDYDFGEATQGTTEPNPDQPRAEPTPEPAPAPTTEARPQAERSASPEVQEPKPLQPLTTYSRPDIPESTAVYTRNVSGNVTSSSDVRQRADSLSVYTSERSSFVGTAGTQKTGFGSIDASESSDVPASSEDAFASDAPATSNTSEEIGSYDPFSQTSSGAQPDSASADAPVTQIQVQAGSKIEAELEVGVVFAGEQTAPVVAKGSDGSIWMGEASLKDTGRVEISFDAVQLEGQQQTLSATALDSQGFTGLQSVVEETTPALAGDLLRGTLRGVSSYAEGLGKQGSVSNSLFGSTVTTTPPPLSSEIAGGVASVFEVQDDSQGLVRIASIPAGTPLTIVVLR